MPSRRRGRECALQMLFQKDVAQTDSEDISTLFWNSHETDPETRHFSERLFKGAAANLVEIDGLIQRHARNWTLERMAIVDRNILRLAVWEFLSGETPAVVVIDEAIEIARRFSTLDSAEFVNGVLDSIRKELEAEDSSE